MKNLNRYAYKCINELIELGIEIGDIDEITINTRAKKRWGQCKYHTNTNTYSISISNRLVDDNVDDMALLNTLMHEILHTCDGCMNHGDEWKHYAEMVNRKYGYHVTRCTSAEEKGLESYQKESYKYVIHCEGCDRHWNYMRYCNIVKCAENDNAKCVCGSTHFWVEYL